MQNIHEIINSLTDAGVHVYVDDGKLKTKSHQGALSAPLIELIKNNKQRIIEQISQQHTGIQRPPIQPQTRAGKPARASHAQQRLWFIDQMDGHSAHYNMPFVLEVDGEFNVAAAQQAFQQIIARHEPLRTLFEPDDDGPWQVPQADYEWLLDTQDLSQLPAQTQAVKVEQLIQADATRCFDLGADLMLRASYLHLGPQRGLLLLNVHHIAFDGWSINILAREWQQLYQANLNNTELELPPLAVQYSDYAVWQQQWLQGPVLAQQLDYWTRQLADLPQVHDLPLDRQRPQQPSFTGALQHFTIDHSTLTALKALAAEQQVTLFMLIHALFAVLLARHSNNTDVVVGTPVANRVLPETEAMIGFFANTLVLRTECSPAWAFVDFLQQVKQTQLAAQANQDVPFEYLVDRLSPNRSTSHNPLFQIMLMMDGDQFPALELPGLHIKKQHSEHVPNKFELTLNISERAGQLRCIFQYNTDLFKAARIKRLATGLQNLCHAVAQNPQQSLGSLPLLHADETQYLLHDLHTHIQVPEQLCAHHLFEQQATAQPEQLALVFGDQQLTYQQLNQRANALASHILQQASGDDQQQAIIGLCAARSIEQVVGLLAILKSGAAYLPIDPSMPPKRIQQMLQDSAVAGVLYQQPEQPDWPSLLPDNAWRVDLAATFKPADNTTASHPMPNLSPDDLAYVIYTSGSTGRPKGVQQTHRTLVNLVHAQASEGGLSQAMRTLQFAPLSFDVSIQELCTSWYTGSPQVLISQADKDQLTQLPELLNKLTIERLFLPPAVLNWLAELLQQQQLSLPHIKELIVAGEALVVSSHLKQYLLAHPEVSLWNHYGPTETHVATVARVDVKHTGTSQPIGRVLANCQALVLDAQQQLVPYGAVGELYLAGAGLARGYVNQAELTAARFVDNPYPTHPAPKLYRSGDWVRYLEDGQLEFLGRMDDQVQIRGFRIELGEIEQQLTAISGVQQALVVVHERTGHDAQLLAYVSSIEPQDEARWTTALKKSLRESLPEYMVPTLFVVLPEFPLTAHGKTDRKALPAPDELLFKQTFVPPSGAVATELAEIWSELLQLPVSAVSATANFFELGGHSLLSVRLISAIQARLDADISIRQVFDCPTLELMAALIEQASESAATAIPLVDRQQPMLASYAQQRLWFIDQLEQGSQHYNMTGSMRVNGAFDLQLAQQAMSQVIQRHEPLRTVFREQDQQLLQQPTSDFEFTISHSDLRGISAAQQQQQSQQLISQINAQAFDLSTDLMLRMHYAQLAAQQGVLIISVHHIAFDGWSISVLLRDFAAHYQALLAGKPCELPPLHIEYADYAHAQRQRLTTGELASQMAYWREQLADLPQVHNLPLDYERPQHQTFSGALHHFQLDAQMLQQLQQLANTQQVTLFMLIHAVFSILLARFSHHPDVVVGTPVANRLRQEWQPLVGFFVNTLVLRTDCSNNPGFVEFLQQVKATHLAAQANQETPFEHLVEQLNPVRSTSHDALFQIMLSMNNNEAFELDLPGVNFSQEPLDYVSAKYDLTLYVDDSGGQLACTFEYNTDLFAASRIEQMADSMQQLLEAVIQDHSTGIHELPIINQAARHELLYALNDTAAAYPDDVCMHLLFELQANKTPSQVAVWFGEQSLTYQQLNQQANQLAHYLISKGVEPDQFIGLCMERSLAMVVGILATFKAGAAYLPLDPSYPQARLDYMQQDSGVDWVLTQQKHLSLTWGQSPLVLDDPLLQATLSAMPTNNPVVPTLHARHLAYAIYTSGSTGQPKGVMVEHQALVNRIDWMQKQYQLTAADVVLQKTPYSFDVSVWEFTWFFTVGASLVLAEPEGHKDPAYLTQLIQQRQVTTLHFVPSMLRAMLRNPDWTNCTSLRQVFCSGEALPADLPPRHYQMNPARLHNLYGPTEAAIDVSYWPVPVADSLPMVPIGRPIQNIQLHVLNEQLQLQPKGAPGELFIGGVGLARGYLNQAELTRQRFIESVPSTGSRLYRTGDLVRCLPDGNLEFLGRVDHQVKLHGLRIELGEIEHQLSQQEVVDASVVMVREDRPGQQQLVAYFTSSLAHSDAELEQQLLQGLQQQLPAYMVPNRCVRLDRMPLSANGKIDRKALPKPESQVSSTGVVPATDARQQLLLEIWSEVLNLPADTISTEANFFALGGDSILSIQVVSRALAAGLKLTVKHIFEHQTISALAAHAVASQQLDIPQTAVQGAQVLLPIQQAFFDDETDLNHHNQAMVYQAPDDLHEAGLIAMVAALYARHDVLRLRFSQHESEWQGNYVAYTDDMAAAAVHTIQLADNGFAQLAQAAEPLQTGLSITDGPVFKAVICRDAAQQIRLLLIAHHLVVDGVSWRIIRDDLEQLYQQQQNHQPLRLAAKSSAYQAWGQLLQQLSQQPHCLQQQSYWQAVLQQTSQPLPRSTSALRQGRGQVTCVLDQATTTQLLNQAPAAYRTQGHELLLAAWLLAFNQWANINHIRIDVEGHGREDWSDSMDLSQTVGWFTSIYPVALSSETMQPDAVIINVKETLRQVPEQGLGFAVLDRFNQAFIDQKNKISPILFNYLGILSDVKSNELFVLTDDSAGPAISAARQADHELVLNGAVLGGRLGFALDYQADLHNQQAMQDLAAAFKQAVSTLLCHCLDPNQGRWTPADFPLCQLSAADLDQWQQQQQITDIYPSTPMQQGLLFHSEVDRSAYVSQLMLHLEAGVDLACLQAAWQAVVDTHSIFRTQFVRSEDGDLLQLVKPQVELPWETHDLSDLATAAQQTAIEQQRLADKQQGFATTDAPLIRIKLWQVADGQHQMLISNHHAILDGWSFSVVFKQVLQGYHALLTGSQPTTKPNNDYRSYVKWLNHQDQAAAQQHWQQQLAPLSGPCHLPMPFGHAHDELEHLCHWHLSQAQTAELERLAQQCQVTVNTLLQASWAYVLSRYVQQDHVVFGTTVSGRPAELPGIEAMVGLFINTIPVVASLDQQQGLHDWLKTMHQQHVASDPHSHIPLTNIQNLLDLPPGESLFNSLLVFENYPIEATTFTSENDDQLRVSEFTVYEEANYELSVMAAVVEGALHLKLTGRPQGFTAQALQQLGTHLVHVLNQVADSDADTEVGDLQLLTEAERGHLQYALNDTVVAYPAQDCIHQQFEQQAAQTPDALAVVYQDQQLSYAELNRQANQLAHHMVVQHGVQTANFVGICMARSPDMVVAMLATLKAGAAYVPLDPAYPEARLQHMLTDSQVQLVITQIPLLAQTQSVPQLVLDDSAVRQALQQAPASNPQSDGLTAQHLAYLIYTSGSTGQPKGVMLEHHAAVNLAWAQIKHFGVKADSRVLHFASINFDAATSEWLMALLSGASLFICPAADRYDPAALTAHLLQQQITHVTLPPAVLQHLDSAPDYALEALIVAGEAFDQQLSDLWAAKYPFYNAYGPSEVTVCATMSEPLKVGQLHMGQAMANTRLYVLDNHLRLAPPGVTGELFVAGVGLARGYLNQPELTAERFIQHRFHDGHQERLYRTGDLVCYTAQDQLRFVGRTDDQIKIRGFRIELAEIEQQLINHHQVQAAVVLVDTSTAEPRLVAYVITEHPNNNELAGHLRQHLQAHLPAHMVPVAVMPLSSFPLTVNGKIDRQALPAPVISNANDQFQLPANDTEHLMVSIWSDLLNLQTSTISATANFFDLGGHSLLAVKLITQISKQMQVNLHIEALFEARNLRELAAHVDMLSGQHNDQYAANEQAMEQFEL